MNRHLKNFKVYKKWQIKLLEEIKSKQKRINTLEKDAQKIKEELQGTLSVLDLSYICSLFLVANDKSISHHDNIQKQKLQNLLKVWVYLGKLPLQICLMKNKLLSRLLSRLSAKLVTFLHLKTKFHCSYILVLFTNFSLVAVMLPIMTKLNILRLKNFQCCHKGGHLHFFNF